MCGIIEKIKYPRTVVCSNFTLRFTRGAFQVQALKKDARRELKKKVEINMPI
jgi:hypothetical protein